MLDHDLGINSDSPLYNFDIMFLRKIKGHFRLGREVNIASRENETLFFNKKTKNFIFI